MWCFLSSVAFEFMHNDVILLLINQLSYLTATKWGRANFACLCQGLCALIWRACHLNFLPRVPLLQNDSRNFKECIASYILQTSLFAAVLKYAPDTPDQSRCFSRDKGENSNIIPRNSDFRECRSPTKMCTTFSLFYLLKIDDLLKYHVISLFIFCVLYIIL